MPDAVDGCIGLQISSGYPAFAVMLLAPWALAWGLTNPTRPAGIVAGRLDRPGAFPGRSAFTSNRKGKR